MKPESSTNARRLLKTVEAATYLGVSPWAIRQMVQTGTLPKVRMGEGNTWRFDLLDLDDFIQRSKERG